MKHWGEHKSPDSYLVDFCAMKIEHNETFPSFNRRFCSIYHGMPLDIRPTETTSMIYYVMALHSKLALLLLERKSSSLSILFEDALEVEENIHVSRRIREQTNFENLHKFELVECQCSSESEQKGNDYEAVSEQQQATKIISDCESDPSTFANLSRDRYSYKVYDQFTNLVKPMITHDCIDNYIFIADQNLCYSNTTLSLFFERYSREEVKGVDDHKVIIK